MCRLLLVAAIVVTTLHHAGAQFGGMPGMPGGPPGAVVPFTAPPPPPSPKCQALLTIRDELQKRGAAIEAVNQKKADVKVACGLFRNYIATEAKMLKMLDTDGRSCGVPAEINKQVRASHAKAQQIAKQVCDAAARGPPLRYAPPPIDDDELRPFRLNPDRRPEPLNFEHHADGSTRSIVGRMPSVASCKMAQPLSRSGASLSYRRGPIRPAQRSGRPQPRQCRARTRC
jgi:hypothetical protein